MTSKYAVALIIDYNYMNLVQLDYIIAKQDRREKIKIDYKKILYTDKRFLINIIFSRLSEYCNLVKYIVIFVKSAAVQKIYVAL